MDVIHPRCAGLDISKKDAKVCVRINGAGRRKTSEAVTTFGATTRQIIALRDHLAAQQVTCVVLEATGDYWKPFYYLLEDLPGVEVMLVNARHVKNLPGRKTDVADATWLAQLGAHGLVRGSFVPPQPIRELRDLTRTRTAVTRERTRMTIGKQQTSCPYRMLIDDVAGANPGLCLSAGVDLVSHHQSLAAWVGAADPA